MRGNHVRIALGAALRGWLAAVAVAAVSLSAHAQSVTSTSAFDRFMNQATGAGKQTVGFGTNGQPMINPGVPTAVPDGGPGVKVTATGSFANPAGNSVGVTGVGRVPNRAIGQRVTKALGRILPGVSTALGIIELAELLEEIGWRRTDDGAIEQKDPYVCTQSPCAGWTAGYGGWFQSPVAACQVAAAGFTTDSASTSYTFVRINPDPPVLQQAGNQCRGETRRKSDGTLISSDVSFASLTYNPTAGGAPVAPVWNPKSMQELEDAIASKAGWPTSSAVARAGVAAADAVGEKLPVTTITVTGPATSPGTTTTKTSPNADGSTKTETTTTTHNHTYLGDTITTTTITTINITNNGTQGSNTTETSSSTPPPDKTACEKDPDTVGCAKLGDPPKDEIPKATKAITYQAEDLGFGGGSCPAPVNLGIGRVLSFQPICDRLIAARPMVLAMAAFSALLIVLGIRSEES